MSYLKEFEMSKSAVQLPFSHGPRITLHLISFLSSTHQPSTIKTNIQTKKIKKKIYFIYGLVLIFYHLLCFAGNKYAACMLIRRPAAQRAVAEK